MRRRHVIFAAVAVVAVAADQITKAVARAALVPGRIEPFVPGFWDWQLAFNTGIAFSVLHGAAGARILLSAIGIIACIAILYFERRSDDGRALPAVALGLVFAGALGNLIDRLVAGQVTDFILWRAGEHRWPRFNVADAALVVGLALLLLADLRRKRR